MIVAADPYPWPYDAELETSRLALVIVGGQEAWMSRSWHVDSVAEVIGAVTSAARAAGALVVHVRTRSSAESLRSRPSAPPPAAPAGSIRKPAATAGPGDLVVVAAGIDGFYGSCLDHSLRSAGVRYLVLAGYGAEATVSSTLRSANDRGYECLTLIDAVAPFDPLTGRHSLSSTTMSGGIFGAIAPAEGLIAALQSLPVLTTAEAIS